MAQSEGGVYYLARQPEIEALLASHAQAWLPFLVARYGTAFADAVLAEARERHAALIPSLPYIGGDDNPMTRHIVRSTTSLALYLAMEARGRTAREVGQLVYEAVAESVSHLPPLPAKDLSPERIAEQERQARRSQERRYAGDWVWEFVLGDGTAFDYGYDFLECGTQKLYRAYGADEFLPFYCYLDFATHRTSGWGFARSMTLAEGQAKCDFRWKRGGQTQRGWPPPF